MEVSSLETGPKRQFKIRIEMESHGKDHTKINDNELFQDISVKAANSRKAIEIVQKNDWGNRIPKNIEAKEQ